VTMTTLIDCHVHTAEGSSDSSLRVEEMVALAHVHNVGVNLTEHNRTWEPFRFEALREESGLFLVRGMEVTTDMGHMIVIGLEQYYSGIRSARRLREVCDDKGAFMIVAHPFRHLLERRPGISEHRFAMQPDEAADTMEIFRYVDAIEVGNGGTAREENAFAYHVARLLGKPMVGGSDAHSVNGFAAYTTGFDEVLTSEADLLTALRSHSSVCVEDLHLGDPRVFMPAEEEAVPRV